MKGITHLAVTMNTVSQSTRKTVHGATAVKAMLANHAVSSWQQNILLNRYKLTLALTSLTFVQQNPKAAPNSFRMVSRPVACTPSIQMAVNQCKCCVT